MDNIIEIDLKSRGDIFNKFNENIISDELGTYIFTQSKKLPLNTEFSLLIDDKIGLNEEEKEILVDAIREYFGLRVRGKLLYAKYNNKRKLFLFAIGMVLIFLSELFNGIFTILIPEMFLIAGWVAISEVMYSVLFIEGKSMVETTKTRKLTECEVRFKKDK